MFGLTSSNLCMCSALSSVCYVFLICWRLFIPGYIFSLIGLVFADLFCHFPYRTFLFVKRIFARWCCDNMAHSIQFCPLISWYIERDYGMNLSPVNPFNIGQNLIFYTDYSLQHSIYYYSILMLSNSAPRSCLYIGIECSSILSAY